MLPCWTIFCASRSAWMLCELAGRGCGQWDLRQAASGFLRSFGRTVRASAEERNSADAWKAHHIGKSGVDGEMIAIADWRCEVGMMQRGLPTWRWQARAPPSPVNRLHCRIPEHTLPLRTHSQLSTTMSRASQITLATTCASAIGIVALVHLGQKQDQAVSASHYATTTHDLTHICLGYACRCHSRLRTAAGEARATSRLRDAEGAAGGIPEIPDSLR
jgi:hypothetical protein